MMYVSLIFIEAGQHEVWKCECKEGKFYIDTLQGYKVVHWNYPEITPSKELLEIAKQSIEQKKIKSRSIREGELDET